MTDTVVPRYTLFGEQTLWPTPEPVHLETIRSRSALYNWEITAHVHADLLQIFVLQKGMAELSLEGETSTLKAPAVICLPPGMIHGFRFQKGVQGHVISLHATVIPELLRLSPELTADFKQPVVYSFAGGKAAFELIRQCVDMLCAEYDSPRDGRLTVLLGALSQLLVYIARAGQSSRSVSGSGRQRQRFARFNELVNLHYKEWQPVPFYADLLGVTPTQLNKTCRQVSGRSALEQIHERLMIEARRLLIYSEIDITAITYSLGFKDTGYFSRFFARNQNCTPTEFRLQFARSL